VHIVGEIGAFHGKEIGGVEAVVTLQDLPDNVFVEEVLVLVQKVLQDRVEHLQVEVYLSLPMASLSDLESASSLMLFCTRSLFKL
jgi:hypothetical protein